MKHKRDAGVATSCGKGANVSANKTRGKASKEKSKPTRSKAGPRSSLTASRVANIIGQLDNKRGSTMESIRSKLVRSGHVANTALVRNALDRAVRAGLLREIKEERFSLPRGSVSGTGSSKSSSTSRTQNKSVTHAVSNLGKRKLKPSSSAARSSSKADAKRRQRRRLQGRRHANADNSGTADGDEGRDLRDDDDAGAGEGDVDDQVGDIGDKEEVSNRVNVTEPVAGCDAVMVFGTH